jgi:hypothetical protein
MLAKQLSLIRHHDSLNSVRNPVCEKSGLVATENEKTLTCGSHETRLLWATGRGNRDYENQLAVCVIRSRNDCIV